MAECDFVPLFTSLVSLLSSYVRASSCLLAAPPLLVSIMAIGPQVISRSIPFPRVPRPLQSVDCSDCPLPSMLHVGMRDKLK
eukprot:748604-Hanusia_phi.AAC.1